MLKKKILTWPNFFTLLRLFCIPVFVYILFVLNERLIAAWLLGLLGATDWVDGWIARKFDQRTDFGAVFDPSVDRLLFFVAVPSIIIDGSVPLWVAGVALLRELGVALVAVLTYLAHKDVMKVSNAGKTGAFFLMFAFPMFLGSYSGASYAGALTVLAWLCTIPGILFGYYSLVFEYIPKLKK